MRYLHQQCGLIPLLHHEPLALLIVQLELRNGLGFGCLLVGCLDIAPRCLARVRRIETRQDRSLAAVGFFVGARGMPVRIVAAGQIANRAVLGREPRPASSPTPSGVQGPRCDMGWRSQRIRSRLQSYAVGGDCLPAPRLWNLYRSLIHACASSLRSNRRTRSSCRHPM